MFGLNLEMTIILVLFLIAAAAFEFINGFHDTANAVATVIYTKSLKPMVAVVWSGMWNFFGVVFGGIIVAMGILNLLPMAALVDPNVYHSIALILAIILTSILWNLGTWYFGLPCSSSHTLLGSIFGVGIAFMFLPEAAGAVALNWGKVKDAGLALLISPIIGFGISFFVIVFLKKKLKKGNVMFSNPEERDHPPLGIRALLILSCTGVSFAHGQNDGQKGVGLIMIILIALVPTKFAIDHSKSPQELQSKIIALETSIRSIDSTQLNFETKNYCNLIEAKCAHISANIEGKSKFEDINATASFDLRKDILTIDKAYKNLTEKSYDSPSSTIDKASISKIKKDVAELKIYIEYVPTWVVILISISLGLGTMIGWQRIVVTVGERIGKTPLNYAQGASAELVAATTIAMSTAFGVPVSTTHVLSSGVAGSMVAKNGFKNLQGKTVRNILTAWLITLPVTIIVSGSLFLLFRWLLG